MISKKSKIIKVKVSTAEYAKKWIENAYYSQELIRVLVRDSPVFYNRFTIKSGVLWLMNAIILNLSVDSITLVGKLQPNIEEILI